MNSYVVGIRINLFILLLQLKDSRLQHRSKKFHTLGPWLSHTLPRLITVAWHIRTPNHEQGFREKRLKWTPTLGFYKIRDERKGASDVAALT